ncbi:hypothetical protein, partial [Blautia wexlerae]|uniref:hypothetical protein n=2 Tax=Blautia wexlerae TaxID=418240 RepID=UPI0034A3F67D
MEELFTDPPEMKMSEQLPLILVHPAPPKAPPLPIPTPLVELAVTVLLEIVMSEQLPLVLVHPAPPKAQP